MDAGIPSPTISRSRRSRSAVQTYRQFAFEALVPVFNISAWRRTMGMLRPAYTGGWLAASDEMLSRTIRFRARMRLFRTEVQMHHIWGNGSDHS